MMLCLHILQGETKKEPLSGLLAGITWSDAQQQGLQGLQQLLLSLQQKLLPQPQLQRTIRMRMIQMMLLFPHMVKSFLRTCQMASDRGGGAGEIFPRPGVPMRPAPWLHLDYLMLPPAGE